MDNESNPDDAFDELAKRQLNQIISVALSVTNNVLDPDIDQQVFEALSNTKEEQAELDIIRRMMKAIIKSEQNRYNKD